MAVYDAIGNALNAVYDASGNLLSQAYDASGNPLIDDSPFFNNAIVTDVHTSTITSQAQGGCMDDDGNIYACLYISGRFIKYNIDTGTESTLIPSAASGSQPWGHANGMAYNPTTGYMYIAAMKDTGEVYAFNPSTGVLVDTLYAYEQDGTTPRNVWNLCYDRVNSRFIHFGGGVIYFYDDDFELITTGSYDADDWALTRQDIETDGTYIYALSWNPNKICIFDMSGNLVKEVSLSEYAGEPEAICYDWESGAFYIEGMDDSNTTHFVIRLAEFMVDE